MDLTTSTEVWEFKEDRIVKWKKLDRMLPIQPHLSQHVISISKVYT